MTALRTTIVALVLAFVMGPSATVAQEMGDMEMGEDYVPDSLARATLAPPVKGYYEGGEAFFIHTEASDSEVAGMLTRMMGPTVAHVPALADVPETSRGSIYVFANGVEGKGPMGFQPDVCAAVPGENEYSPFVEIHQVRWADDAEPRVLRSAGAIQEAASNGELTIESTGIVVNAPVLAWPDGHR